MNKKTIILGLIALAALGGIIWYASQSDSSLKEQAASILGTEATEKESSQSAAEESFRPVEEEFVLGNPQAPVTIIEYSSHFCGHCANFHLQTLPLITEKYIKNGQVKLIPRRVSPSELGQALLCAQEQGEFWSVDDYLFGHVQELILQTQKATSNDDLTKIVIDWLGTMAANLGLNQDSFNQCLVSGRYQERVVAWFNQAEEAGVSGTPTFFINDQMIVGNQPYSQFEKLIEQELAQ